MPLPQELIARGIAAIVGVTLLGTARQLRREPVDVGPLMIVGAAVGVAVPLLPVGLLLWAAGPLGTIDLFGDSDTPVADFLVPFGLLLLWAMASAVSIRRHATRPRERRAIAIAVAAPILLLGVVTLGGATGVTGSWVP